jgi:hypothetical protein
LGKNIQDIAHDQKVSIIKIKRWIDKLDIASNDLDNKN